MSNRYLSSIVVVFLLLQSHQGWSQNNVGVDVATPLQKLDVNGGIRIGTTSNALAGSIRWTGTRFEGYNGSQWVSFETPSLLNGRIFVGNASDVATGVFMSGDATVSNTGVLTIANSAVTSAKIADGTIVNADVDAAAAIARTKLASGTANRLLVNNGSGVMSEMAAGTNGDYLQLVGGVPTWGGASGFIRNQTTLQTSSDFYISGVGRTDGSFLSPVYSRADAGTVAIRPNTDAVTAIQLQNAAGTSILNVDATNSRIGIGNVAPDEALEVTGNILLSRASNRVISLETAASGVPGWELKIQGCNASTAGAAAQGGPLVLQAGAAYNLTGGLRGGNLVLRSGANQLSSTDAINGGNVVFETGGANGTFVERMLLKESGTLVSHGHVYVDDNSKGVVLRSPNNSCWRLVVDNSGNLTTTSITCP